MKLAASWQMTLLLHWLHLLSALTNRIWTPLGDWPLWPNHVRYRNVWYLVGKIIHRAIFSQKWKFLPWSSDALLAIKIRGRKRPPGFQRSKKPGAHRVKFMAMIMDDGLMSRRRACCHTRMDRSKWDYTYPKISVGMSMSIRSPQL